MWRAHDGMGWWMLWGGGLWLLFWVAIIYFVVTALGRSSDRPPTSMDRPTEHSALEIARRRYASGEITREQYQQLCDDLAGAGAEPPRPG